MTKHDPIPAPTATGDGGAHRPAETFPPGGSVFDDPSQNHPPRFPPLWTTLAAAVFSYLLYQLLATSSRATCPGGMTNDGGFLDAEGNPTTQVPMCLGIQVRPSAWVGWTILGIVVIAVLYRQLPARRVAIDPWRVLGLANAAILVLGAGAAFLSFAWSSTIDVSTWDGHSEVSLRPPLGVATVQVTISPMIDEL